MHFNNLSIKDAFHLFSNLKGFSSLSYLKTTTLPAEHEHPAVSAQSCWEKIIKTMD